MRDKACAFGGNRTAFGSRRKKIPATKCPGEMDWFNASFILGDEEVDGNGSA
jgi:hypothetical protein